MKIITIIVYLLFTFLISVKSNCDGCRYNAITPCVMYIAEGIEKYCDKKGDTSRCYCDWR